VERRRRTLSEAESNARLAREALDLTEELERARIGHAHVITQTWERLEDVFVGMGFTIAAGPEVETDWFNFEALNLPPSHPARSLWDTLYLDTADLEGVANEQLLLRTHTSPVQVRTMLAAVRDGSGPPIHVVCPGRVYRRDTADATHLPVFHQIEMLVVDRNVTMADLAGTIEEFTKAYFGEDLTSRLRPSYFPFTEPSAEVDISQPDGSWLEVGGCGMVHPNVLRSCGLDPEEWSGFAFGFGIDRLAKIRHGVGDLREFVTNDVRFLEQL
jgi:phenylalanyl-tRNA synthetase alpha chain